MSPSHTNKGGVRYRYYVCQALLQGKLQGAGSIGRVPAAETEALVLTALRQHLQASGAEPQPTSDCDRDLIERHVERIMLTPKHITLHMRPASAAVPAGTVAEGAGHNAIGDLRVATMAIPWSGPAPATLQGIVHVPAHGTPIKAPRRETLLTAIAKARQWVDDMAQGRTATFAQIARREDKVERHVRLLAPLAFLSPRIVAAIIDGTAPANLTATSLARALPYSWAEQESRLTGIMPLQENDVLLEPSMPVPT
jgi:site-specific DNA recombinase